MGTTRNSILQHLNDFIATYIMLCICIHYSEESATIIVMQAFGVLPIKSVSRTRLMSAGRFFLKADQRKILLKAENNN